MSWFSTIILCLLSAITTIGALKRVGWISVHPEQVQSAGTRKAFEAAVTTGDLIVAKGMVAGAIIVKKSFELYDAAKGRRRAAE
ncbi:hypothetical protein MPTK1_5g03630 [Marchantia polymorpha subsp. ruderalis]|uniref:Uncharacterized protein n=2 Tax=Marchantia polymorpha TaxID=3197 RepID=A0A176WQK3_MARPO|nr:hypothetical protein AXG93_2587s1230 [Marchantia polymorpha subsp. ruderalis]PTQ29878.1 hypothetical protein MARPO_0133s0026 [Marchantia polymorpha]BBN10447.1 hypothetical protein Mp_5g03630 [Marchantia polymorpha subsp. ruderalis]|eukprot:PTQ29878.1 hypothetical protein MARPO_0133s0026 [Marchantia polymorpha]